MSRVLTVLAEERWNVDYGLHGQMYYLNFYEFI